MSLGTGPLAICYGTRPQVIKALMLIEATSKRWPLVTIDTGQHYDYALNEVFYEQLGVRKPNHFLEVGSAAHAVQTAHVLTRAAQVFEAATPRAVVVIGDTNSTLGCALAAVQMRIPMVHVEAGLRSNDRAMAEEINRRVVDSVADLLCAPSAAASAQLELEHQWGAIVNTGDIAHDVLKRNLAKAIGPAKVKGWPLKPGEAFAIATLHRAELTGSAESLRAMVGALRALPLPVVLPAHPRVRDALATARTGLERCAAPHVTTRLLRDDRRDSRRGDRDHRLGRRAARGVLDGRAVRDDPHGDGVARDGGAGCKHARCAGEGGRGAGASGEAAVGEWRDVGHRRVRGGRCGSAHHGRDRGAGRVAQGITAW